MTQPDNKVNIQSDARLQAVSEALEMAAADLQELVKKMKKALDENQRIIDAKSKRKEPKDA